jgi:hypothetical protein
MMRGLHLLTAVALLMSLTSCAAQLSEAADKASTGRGVSSGAKDTTDTQAGARFTLQGKRLTVFVLPGAPAHTLSSLRSLPLDFACSDVLVRTPYVGRAKSGPMSPSRRQITVELSKDVSQKLGVCNVSGPNDDIAVGLFRPPADLLPREYRVTPPPHLHAR